MGQLFMVAAKATGADATTMADLANYHTGNVYLAGRSHAGTRATAAVVAGMTATVSAASTGGVPLFVATDQEGGYVQVLNGPGFSVIPTALAQSGSSSAQIQASARLWGSQLLQGGVNVDLAPVLDTVPGPQSAASNPPIGFYQREYGFAPAQVSAQGNAFAAGLREAGVAPVVKHFPGLGRVLLNTDVSGNVHDTLTTISDAYLEPYRAAIRNGVRWVMVSNAYYDRIDPANIAAFSTVIMGTMLRSDAGFTGIIVSDDLCNAVQLAPWALGDRAVDFIGAGGTMVLCADPLSIPVMYNKVLQRAQGNAAFRAEVDAATLTVLRVKAGH
ncbi:glycoside hydrolase family 3 N-terminal domain-containing protein [Micrococcaceae bacterium Sec5.7]